MFWLTWIYLIPFLMMIVLLLIILYFCPIWKNYSHKQNRLREIVERYNRTLHMREQMLVELYSIIMIGE